jgi:uncharacterized protein with NRDE domain
MCLAVFAWKVHPKYKIVLAANRDEFYARPTLQAAEWPDQPDIIAGKDLKAEGTWLGVGRNSKLAFLTNYRDIRRLKNKAPSRGSLVTDFLKGSLNPVQYLQSLENPHLFNGFNLIVSDLNSLYWYSNVNDEIRELEPGIYGISNYLLNTPWRKVEQLRLAFAKTIEGDFNYQQLFQSLLDTSEAEFSELPDTGLDPNLEKKLSACFIRTPDYGTVSSSVILADYAGNINFHERTYIPNSNDFKDKSFLIKCDN